MRELFYKEIRLALHPTTLLFLALSAMLLIPNYPYYVVFFYTCLGTFFLCLNGRENRDIYYSALLPVRKGEIVRARFLTVLCAESAQLALAALFALLRGALEPQGNAAGMDANIAFFGVSLALLGVFHYVFFTRYYRRPDRVGSAFALGSAAFALCMFAAEAAVFAIPFVRDRLDTPDPAYLPEKLGILAVGLALYGALTALAYHRAKTSFEALDL